MNVCVPKAVLGIGKIGSVVQWTVLVKHLMSAVTRVLVVLPHVKQMEKQAFSIAPVSY